jgi:hypothetical protein
MSNINKKVKIARLKKTIKITSNIIKISLENLIDDVNKKTSSIQKEVHDVFEKINKLPGKKYQYKEKFVIDEDHPNFTNEIDKLDYIHESLIFKYAQLEIKLNTLTNTYKKKLEISVNVDNTKKDFCGVCKYKKSSCICANCIKCKNKNYEKCKCSISAKLRIDVWQKYIGININSHKCLCCLKNVIQFSPSNYHCGHIKSRYNEGSISIHNLRPICKNCNKEMGILNMNEYIKIYHPRLV